MTEKMKILIGYDGSTCAEAALDDLQRAGLPPLAEALVMSVTETWLPLPPASSYEILEQAREVHVPFDMKRVYAKASASIKEADLLTERAVARLRTNFPGWTIKTATSIGSPSRELIKKADEWQPNLIVIGSHGRSRLGRLVLGSVSQGVLTYAHCSVRVARGRIEEPDTAVRIIISVDGSPISKAAVQEVATRVWPLGSEVRIIAVNDPLSATFVGKFIPPIAEIVEESNQAERKWLGRILESSSQLLRESELRVSSEIREGDPKHVLIKAAREWDADCIFAGSIGFGNPFERFVLGSVSASLAARAHCSVEVVRPTKKLMEVNHHGRQSKFAHN